MKKRRLLGVAIENNEGKILLIHRVPTRSFYPDYWHILGANIEEEEDPETCLARELKEEIDVDDFEIVKKVEPFTSIASENNKEYEINLFKCRTDQHVKIVDPENDRFEWIESKEIYNYRIIKSLPSYLRKLGYNV